MAAKISRYVMGLMACFLLLGNNISYAQSIEELPPEDEGKKPAIRQRLSEEYLMNGLSIQWVADTAIPGVTMVAVVRAGTLHETLPGTARLNLAASLVAHPHFQSPDSFQVFLAQNGIVLDGLLTRDATLLRMRMPAVMQEVGLATLSAMLQAPNFEPETLEKARKTAAFRMQKAEENPLYYLAGQILEQRWGGEASRFNPTGTYLDIRRRKAQDLAVFRQQFYHPNHTMLLIGGDFDRGLLQPGIDSLLGSWKHPGFGPEDKFPVEIPTPNTDMTWSVVVNEFISYPMVSFSWVGPDLRLEPLSGRSAELFCAIANRSGSTWHEKLVRGNLANEFEWQFLPGNYHTEILLTVHPNPDSLAACVQAVQKLVAGLGEKEVPETDRIAGVKQLKLAGMLEREKTSTWLMTLGNRWRRGEPPLTLDAEWEAISPADIISFENKYLRDQFFTGIGLMNSEWVKKVDLANWEPVPVATVEAVPIPDFNTLKIYFDSDQARPDSVSMVRVREVVRVLEANPSLELYVNGYTDGVGDGVHNYQLSIVRAQLIRDILVEGFGIQGDRLEVRGYGEAFPDYPDDTPEQRALNRRVVFEWKKGGPDE